MAGIPLADYLKPYGAFPILRDEDLQGGFRVVADLTALSAIIPANRTEGMLVYVVSEDKFYQLASDLTTWNQALVLSHHTLTNLDTYDDHLQYYPVSGTRNLEGDVTFSPGEDREIKVAAAIQVDEEWTTGNNLTIAAGSATGDGDGGNLYLFAGSGTASFHGHGGMGHPTLPVDGSIFLGQNTTLIGDFTLSGIADRIIEVAIPPTTDAGYDLTIQAGDANTSGAGGDLVLNAGEGFNDNISGGIYLGSEHTNEVHLNDDNNTLYFNTSIEGSPTEISIGAISDGELLKRVGTEITSIPASGIGVTDHEDLTGIQGGTTGVIYKGSNRFIHNFALAGTNGLNTFIGEYSGNFTMTGSSGDQGSENTGCGYATLYSLTTGAYNSAFGFRTLQNNKAGTVNVGMGAYTLYNNTDGAGNMALGYYSMYNNQTGANNIAIGINTLYQSTASSNVAIGASAGYSLTNGSGNLFLGYQAGYHETGSNKLYISNSNTATPLIGGDFSAQTVNINGMLTASGIVCGPPDIQTGQTIGLDIYNPSLSTSIQDQWSPMLNIGGTYWGNNDGMKSVTRGLSVQYDTTTPCLHVYDNWNNGGLTEFMKIYPVGDLEIMTAGSGIILTSPNSSRWRLYVDDSGNLHTQAA